MAASGGAGSGEANMSKKYDKYGKSYLETAA